VEIALCLQEYNKDYLYVAEGITFCINPYWQYPCTFCVYVHRNLPYSLYVYNACKV
jgi:hypothetical protein